MQSNSKAFTWISPYSPDDSRGGWKSMQSNLLKALETRLGPSQRIAPVEAPESSLLKWYSRLLKKLRIPRPYAHFSNGRLTRFARLIDSRLSATNKNPVVYFGPLPFVKCKSPGPYFIYTDGTFFIHYYEYCQDHSHSRSDIQRICQAEAEFMRNAACVWCSSQWVANRILTEYSVPRERVCFVGTGPGDVPAPVEPITYENFLVMVAADFERKQGTLAVKAVESARKMGSRIKIKFIGDRPPEAFLKLDFVEWCGWLRMDKADDRLRFSQIMSRAGAHILLSRVDLTPLAIPEAASYAKATIATKVGGIPEMIKDTKSGWLIDPREAPDRIGDLLAKIFSSPELLQKTGAAAKQLKDEVWNWESVADQAILTMKRA